jgi:hypothetical protein
MIRCHTAGDVPANACGGQCWTAAPRRQNLFFVPPPEKDASATTVRQDLDSFGRFLANLSRGMARKIFQNYRANSTNCNGRKPSHDVVFYKKMVNQILLQLLGERPAKVAQK